MVEENIKGANRVKELTDNPSSLLASILVGNNVVNIASSSLATVLAINLIGSRGVAISTIIMTIVGAVFNYFILIPLYATIMGGMANVIGASAAGNSNISSLTGIIVLGITPFNIIKGAIVSLITFVSYKRISPLLNRENVLAEQAMKKGA